MIPLSRALLFFQLLVIALIISSTLCVGFDEGGNTIYSGEIIATLNPPAFMVSLVNSSENITYVLRYVDIVEFMDMDMDGVFGGGDKVVAIGILNSTSWNITYEPTAPVTETGQTDYYSVRALVSGKINVTNINGSDIGTADIIFACSIFRDDVYVRGYPVRGQMELKIDFNIYAWPTNNDDSLLMLRLKFYALPVQERVSVTYSKEQYGDLEISIVTITQSMDESAEFRYSNYTFIQNDSLTRKPVGSIQKQDTYPIEISIIYPHGGRGISHDQSIRLNRIIQEGGKANIAKYGLLITMFIAIIVVTIVAVMVTRHLHRSGRED